MKFEFKNLRPEEARLILAVTSFFYISSMILVAIAAFRIGSQHFFYIDDKVPVLEISEGILFIALIYSVKLHRVLLTVAFTRTQQKFR